MPTEVTVELEWESPRVQMQEDSAGDNLCCASVCLQGLQQERLQKSWKDRKGMKTTGRAPDP